MDIVDMLGGPPRCNSGTIDHRHISLPMVLITRWGVHLVYMSKFILGLRCSDCCWI